MSMSQCSVVSKARYTVGMPFLMLADALCTYLSVGTVEWLGYFPQSWRQSLICGNLLLSLAMFTCSMSHLLCVLLGLWSSKRLSVVLVIVVILSEAPYFCFAFSITGQACAGFRTPGGEQTPVPQTKKQMSQIKWQKVSKNPQRKQGYTVLQTWLTAGVLRQHRWHTGELSKGNGTQWEKMAFKYSDQLIKQV